MTQKLNSDQQAAAISLIRGMAMDAPLYAKSGHQGTAMALAPLAHVLFSRVMKFDPAQPEWADRDRFVLSNGHASILQYTMLYLTGMGLELDDLKAFRTYGSRTPGHPEAGHTVGVEVTTGPLGQGFADSVGLALAERLLREEYGEQYVDHHTWVFAGDGDMMEGVSHEAASMAGHLGLGRLIVVFDDNRITIDGSTDLSCSDDIAERFSAYGWHVEHLGEIADDCDALEAALVAAKADDRPSLLVLRTHVATPSPDHTDDYHAHGNPFTVEDVTRTKEVMGIPDEPYWAPPELVAAYREVAGARGAAAHAEWAERFEAMDAETRTRWDAAHSPTQPMLDGWESALPEFAPGDKPMATRSALEKVLTALIDYVPGLVAGAADLTGNTGVKIDGIEAQSETDPAGRGIHYGIREHAMGAALVGMARHGGLWPVGGTFFVFSDYMRPPIRLAVMSHAKALFVFSHDSVAVGQDGPTHQPIEHLAALRAIPTIHLVRPADANEVKAAVTDALTLDGPTVLILTRQNVPIVTDGGAVARGAGVVGDPVDDPRLVIVATGSEVAVALDAAATLNGDGVATRVVSLPSWDRFADQGRAYRDELLPPGVPVVSVEAGATYGWERYADATVGIDRFGASAPGEEVLAEYGITPDHVVAVARELLDAPNA